MEGSSCPLAGFQLVPLKERRHLPREFGGRQNPVIHSGFSVKEEHGIENRPAAGKATINRAGLVSYSPYQVQKLSRVSPWVTVSVNVGFFVVEPGHQGVWLGAEKARQCRTAQLPWSCQVWCWCNDQKRLRDTAMRLVRASRVSQSTQCTVLVLKV